MEKNHPQNFVFSFGEIVGSFFADASKIKNQLDWLPKESFTTGIEKTIQWYLDNEGWLTAIQNNTYQQQRLGLGGE